MKRLDPQELDNEFEREVCWKYDEAQYFNPDLRKASVMEYHLRLSEVIRTVRESSPGRRVADLACAQGNFSLLLAEDGFDVTAVDIKPEFLNYLRKKQTHGKVHTVLANVMEYFSEQPFDCVILGEIIEHVARPADLLAAAHRNLCDGGVVVVTTPNGNHYGSTLPTFSQVRNPEELIPRQFHWLDHLFLYTSEELTGLLRKTGFEIMRVETFHSSHVSELKALRYLAPRVLLEWAERKTRNWHKKGKDSTNCLIAVARKLPT